MDRNSLLHLLEDEEPSSPDTNPDVMKMVREQLERDPPPPLSALYGRALRIDPEIRNLDLRQFNAKYPLQVRRRKKREQESGGRNSSPGTKRRRKRDGRDGSGEPGRSSGSGRGTSGGTGRAMTGGADRPAGEADGTTDGADRPASGSWGRSSRSADGSAQAGPGSAEARALRARVRDILIQYAKAIVGAETRAEALEAILQAETYADTLAHLAARSR